MSSGVQSPGAIGALAVRSCRMKLANRRAGNITKRIKRVLNSSSPVQWFLIIGHFPLPLQPFSVATACNKLGPAYNCPMIYADAMKGTT